VRGEPAKREEGLIHIEDDPILQAGEIDSIRAALEQLEKRAK